MTDETTDQFDGTSNDPVEADPASNPHAERGEQPPQGPTQEDTQRKIYPTDPTGADPA
ncbi:hypothetical protein [Cellulomonas sp. HZM]|uniref:hypothetical protein n=1 Tax=Cellulomonas sp. HZM TaxID=1454010 RepID=UPI000AACE284|nr:hypothetical protein [Cellulomonas sp. HZM]